MLRCRNEGANKSKMKNKDTIYREDAINVLKERLWANRYSNVDLISELNHNIGDLMRLPSSTESKLPIKRKCAICPHCNNCDVNDNGTIKSTQAIKDCRNCKHGFYNDHWETYFCYVPGACKDWDKWEPAIQPEREKGEWIKENRGGVEYTAVCSKCGYGTYWSDVQFYNYCPSCGEWMKGKEEQDEID